jgi:predicted acetyltransferase
MKGAAMLIELRPASADDAPLLARLNKHLIEDEGSDNLMSVAELETHMRQMLTVDYEAFMFYSDDGLLGYALLRISQNLMYLRQFFICSEIRRRGFGKAALLTLS